MKMKRVKLLLLLAILLGGFYAVAQVSNDEILMTIAGRKVTVGEFLTIYQKNNVKNQPIDKKSLDEYVDLFINFKLKVREAEDLGLDTATAFQTELAGYRDQLAKPYFIDEDVLDRLVKEAYDRSKLDIRASHIFVRVKQDALPPDTLAAYQKISKIRERLVNGENFEELAVELSEDPSAKDREANNQHPFIRGNKGDLGYFTVFDMVYPFETGAYSTEVGKISKIVKTEYGYHVLKVTKKQPAMGKVVVAHLFLAIPKGAKTEDSLKVQVKIDSLYGLLEKGGNWDDLVKMYSDDKGSAAKAGVLPKFGVNRMVPEFIDAIYLLKKPGDYTRPILTPYGWHIVKLVEREPEKSFDDQKADLKQRVLKDSRSQLARDAVLEKIKKEYGFTENPTALVEFYPVVTDSVFFGKWNPEPAMQMNNVLFTIGPMKFFQRYLAEYIAGKQRKMEKENIQYYVNQSYTDYVNESLMKWEDSHLEKKYPEFKALVTEYRDGILLFDLTDQKVWSKAVKDTTGLKDFYEKNKNNYMWDERLDATIYTTKDPAVAKKARNFLSTGLNDDAILKEINTDTTRRLTIESGKFSKKDNKCIDQITWAPGISPDLVDGQDVVFVNVKAVLKPEPKKLNEARGMITADYQNYLEKEWVKALRQKYPVTVNQVVLDKIK
jgi:peptidyl-prolyl cis-trans isomerase SurA